MPNWRAKVRRGIDRFNDLTSNENIAKYVTDDPLGYRQLLSDDPHPAYSKIEQEVQGMFSDLDLMQGFPRYQPNRMTTYEN